MISVAINRQYQAPSSADSTATRRSHGRHMLWSLPARNVIVQARNCGTANGVLLGLLRILERNPLAHIVLLPADHYVHDEALLADSMRTAANFVEKPTAAPAHMGRRKSVSTRGGMVLLHPRTTVRPRPLKRLGSLSAATGNGLKSQARHP